MNMLFVFIYFISKRAKLNKEIEVIGTLLGSAFLL